MTKGTAWFDDIRLIDMGATVNNTADTMDTNPGDGVCADSSGTCTLRAAIQETNAFPGADTINVPAGTYLLSIEGTNDDVASTGDLDITEDLTIIGAGENDTIIDANRIDRVFHLLGPVTAKMSNLTIMNGGNTDGLYPPFYGGAIYTEANASLIMYNCTISDCPWQGAIYNAGDVSLNDCNILRNTNSHSGAGIHNVGNLTVNNCTFSDNDGSESGGGGISNLGYLTANNCTFSNNIGSPGGAILTGGIAILSNTTISDNKANVEGGGIQNWGNLELNNCTISDNEPLYPNDETFLGGGIYSSGTAKLRNTIIANNKNDNCFGTITSLGHNLDSGNTCGFDGPGDLVETNPLLGPLADKGGPTLTHALHPDSPAIDAGDNTSCLDIDQRGIARPQDGDNDGEAICDIGAYEYIPMDNLLVNGSFEYDSDGDNNPDNWVAVEPAELDSTESVDGHYSAKIKSTGWRQRGSRINRQYVDLKPNTTYILSAWIKTENVTSDAQVYPYDYDGVIDTQLILVRRTTDWTHYSMQFTTGADPSNAQINFRLTHLQNAYYTGTAWFDDIRLVEF